MKGWVRAIAATIIGVAGAVASTAWAAGSTGWSIPGKKAPELEQPDVTVRLIAEREALIPQADNRLAVVINQQNGWHTYWTMPGDAGFPTRFTFNLPEKLSATEPEVPYPERLDTMGIISFAFNGETVFPFRVSVPRDVPMGAKAKITLEADYLACKDVCVPGHASTSIELPYAVKADASSDAALLKRGEMLIPEKTRALKTEATVDGTKLEIKIPSGEVAIHHALSFFPLEANQIVLANAPRLARTKDGSSALYLTLTKEFAVSTPKALRGVLVADGGPLEKGGWAVETTLPLSAGTVIAPLAENEPDVIDGSHAASLTALTAIGFAFFGGLILNLMPCVFPVLSLKILHLLESGRRGEPMLGHGLATTAGVLVTMLSIAGVLILLRNAGMALGWGFYLQSSWVVAALLLLFVAISLNLLGLYEFTLGTQLGNLSAARPMAGSKLHSFLSGVLAVVVASPCTAPFMGAALGYALTRPSLEALGIFAALGIGMSLPWLLLCLFPSWSKWLPKPGAWMNTFRRVMAIPMLAAALWLVWVLNQQLNLKGLLVLALAVLALGLSLWLIGRAQWGKSSSRILAASLSILAVGAVASVGMGLYERNASAQAHGTWQPWSESAVEAALTKGQPVFVDFTAAWCITCQANKAAALNRDAVQEALNRYGYARFVGDWTNYDPQITKELERFHRSGVPLYLVYRPNGQVTVLPELLTPGIVLEALEANAKP